MRKSQLSTILKNKKIHFIAIGGIGMSALARFLHAHSTLVSGSDKSFSNLTNELINEGIKNIWAPHSEEKIKEINPDYVIYSTAVNSTNNAEIKWAELNNKTILHRSELLDLISKEKKLISISGTHGKTTTTAMVCETLMNAGIKTSGIIGGILNSKNTNSIAEDGEYFVIEADESDKSFLKGEPEIGIITNIEPDHLENYNNNFGEIKKSFLDFAKKSIRKTGLIVCREDKNISEFILKELKEDPRLITYGFYTESNPPTISTKKNNDSWDIFLRGEKINSISLPFPGKHNALNMLAAYAVGHLLNVEPNLLKKSLESYKGVKRRFEYIIKDNELTVVDDYAHHPTEIMATIDAARELNPERLVLILQPHHPKRVKDLWNEFKECLASVNELLFITDIYVARGGEIEGITSKKLVEEINKPNINYLPGNLDEIQKKINEIIKPKDLVLMMGAGNITDVAKFITCNKRETIETIRP